MQLASTTFFGHEITRLIVGDNPFNGHSYITDRISGQEMLDFHTSDVWQKTLFEIEANGFTCMMPLADPFVLRMLGEYKRNGGKMKFIFQPYNPMDQLVSMRQMAALEPIGIYQQGTSTDYLWETGNTAEIKRKIAEYRTMGIPVGLGSHVPEVIRTADQEDWDVDFFVCCLHNARRGRRGEVSGFLSGKSKAGLIFYPEDRPVMLDVIRSTAKPCIAFKIFAGGQMFMDKTPGEIREAIKNAYREVFTSVKPTDVAAIGVFQKYGDQIAEDAALFREVMKEIG